MENDSADAQAQLDALERDRVVIRQRLELPWWQSATFGFLLGGYLLGVALGPESWETPLFIGINVAFLVVVVSSRRNGFRFRPGSGVKVGTVLMFVIGALGATGAWFARKAGVDWLVVVMAVTVATAAGVTMHILNRLELQRLRDES